MKHPDKSVTHLNYRPDIDGLRALAVMAVILFHAFPEFVHGGFVGVDVFFAISGYLISSIIFVNLDNDTFSFSDFYSRRIRRIFPALILTLSACFGLGWFIMLSDEYKQLGKHLAGGASFISNFILWNEAGYFDNSAETKPLLHLWSLGIEEQFYIAWPLIVWFSWKQKFNLLTIAILIALTSFTLNIKGVKHDSIAAFYSPQTRIWELMFGSLLAWASLYKSKTISNIADKFIRHISSAQSIQKRHAFLGSMFANITSLTGLLLLAYAFYKFNPGLNYPGKWALIPVLGGSLILMAGTNAWINRAVLSNKIVVWFGLISYPLYLWHWPLLSFARIYEGEIPSLGARVATVALSIGLAWITYKFIERPIRFGMHAKSVTTILLLLLLLIGYIGYNVYSKNGLAFRYGQSEIATTRYQLDAISKYDYFNGSNEEQFWANGCFNIKDNIEFFKRNGCDGPSNIATKKIVIIGDSHSAYLSQYLRPYLLSLGYTIFQYSTAFCTPLSTKDRRTRCNEINQFAYDRIKSIKPEVVLLFSHYTQYQQESNNTESQSYDDFLFSQTKRLSQLGVGRVLFIGQMPTWKDGLPHVLLRNYLSKGNPIPTRTYTGINKDSLDFDTKLSSYSYPPGVSYVSLRDFLCNENGCLTMVGTDLNSGLIVFDYGHLTTSGAEFITKNLLYKYFYPQN